MYKVLYIIANLLLAVAVLALIASCSVDVPPEDVAFESPIADNPTAYPNDENYVNELAKENEATYLPYYNPNYPQTIQVEDPCKCDTLSDYARENQQVMKKRAVSGSLLYEVYQLHKLRTSPDFQMKHTGTTGSVIISGRCIGGVSLCHKTNSLQKSKNALAGHSGTVNNTIIAVNSKVYRHTQTWQWSA